MSDYNRQTVRQKFKDGYLETHAGSRLKALGIHPVVTTMISVETEDGFHTTIDRHDLVENEALTQLYAGHVSAVVAVADPTAIIITEIAPD